MAVTSPKYREKITELNEKVRKTSNDPYYGAPVVILVLADGNASNFVEDGSCVLMNMMLAAHSLGLGTVWVAKEREIFDSEEGKELLKELAMLMKNLRKQLLERKIISLRYKANYNLLI